MKSCRLALWVNESGDDRGQRTIPCLVEYEVNPPFKGSLYRIVSCRNAKTKAEYPLEGPTGILALNGPLDEVIAASDKVMVAFAKKELGVDLKQPKKPTIKKPAVKPKEPNDLPDLF